MNQLWLNIFIGIVVVGIFIFIFQIYNALVAVRENIQNAWANIEVLLKQRYDEIPQLIKICRQYLDYEEAMINRIMSAREKMIRGGVEERGRAYSEVSRELKGLLALSESYPELQSNKNFLQIQQRISKIEENLADRREFYNNTVNIYNIRIQQIPEVFFALLLRYERRPLLVIREEERQMPDLTIRHIS
jgi:LemA protein